MARKIVFITVLLWLVGGAVLAAIGRMPALALLPLYGLYPGAISSGERGYSLTAMHTWAVGIAIVFVLLAVAGAGFRKKPAAIALLVLFLISTFASCARLMLSLGSIH